MCWQSTSNDWFAPVNDRNRVTHLDPIQTALDALGRGEFVIVVDDDLPASDGVLVGAAASMTAESMAWMARNTSGAICAPMTNGRADNLQLPLMVTDAEGIARAAFTVSVDLIPGNSSGTSPADRARTLAALASDAHSPKEFSRPGHVAPLRARPGGVLKRAGHTEAAIDLCRLADQPKVGAMAELITAEGEMMRLADCRTFADKHGLALISITDLVKFRRKSEKLVEHFAAARLPTSYGEFVAHAYRSVVDGEEHVAYVMGDVDGGDPPLVRVHSECLTGDILASIRCDCGPQLQLALKMIADEGRGVLVYLRGHEGRGIGIGHKLRAYALQDTGLDTVDANSAQGLPVDSREYGVGAGMLADLGVRQMRLMTNNPTKLGGLDGYGLEIVERVGIEIPSNPENLRYLETKRTRMGHTLGEAQA